MLIFLSAVLFALAVIGGLLVNRWITGNAYGASPISIAVFLMTVAIAPGVLLTLYDHPSVDSAHAIALPISMASYILGYVLTARPIPYSSPQKRVKQSHGDPLALLLFSLVVLIACMFRLHGGIPPVSQVLIQELLGNAILTDYLAISEIRAELTKGHVFGGQYSGSGLVRELAYISGALAGGAALTRYIEKQSATRLLLLFLIMVVVYIVVAGDGTRGRFAIILLTCFSIYALSVPVTSRQLAMAIGGSIFAMVVVTSFSHKGAATLADEGIARVVEKTLERVTSGNSRNDILVIDLIESNRMDLGSGYWFVRDLQSSLPGKSIDKPLAYYLYIYSIGGNATTYLTPTAIGRGYADGGHYGVAILFFVAGLLGGIIPYVFPSIFNLRKDAAFLPVQGVLVTSSGLCVFSGLTSLIPTIACLAILLGGYHLLGIPIKAMTRRFIA